MSTTAVQPRRLSPAEYLSAERAAEQKSEYVNGEVYALSGVSREHSLIVGSLHVALYTQLRGRPCEVHMSDLRVKVSDTGMYTYPDVTVVCGEPRFEDAHVDTLLDPIVLVEVLSPSTEAYDRGAKFAHYRRLPSLQEYLLVAQDRPLVERYRRDGAAWVLTEAAGLEASVTLDAIDCTLRLRDVYERVTFADAPTRAPLPPGAA